MKRVPGIVAAWAVLLGLAGVARASEPGELFPNVPFQTESASDGSTAKDALPPPPPKVEIPVPFGMDSVSPTTKPSTDAVVAPPAQPAAYEPAAPKLPWFLSTAAGKEVLDKIIADPKEGLKSAKELAAGKTAAEQEEGELLTAIGEYVTGQNMAAYKRFERLAHNSAPRRVRASLNYLEVMGTYAGGKLKNASLADPGVLAEATGMCVRGLVQKAQDLGKKAAKAQVDNLDSYNKGVELFVQAKAALSLADYLQPEADHTPIAQEILKGEIGLRRRGIELILARADKRKERIDQIGAGMKFNKDYQGASNVWSPRASALEVNAFVDGMLRDKKRAEELLAQIQELLTKSAIQEDLGDLGERIANADKVKVDFPRDWGRDSGRGFGRHGGGGWSSFKHFGNLYQMFQDDPGDQDPDHWFHRHHEGGWITVKPISPCP